jgi:hypothetical protein
MANSTAQGGPSIITDKLILHLDAANPESYPGSGTTWTDLNSKSYSGTLVNDPIFNRANAGTFLFNGTDEYVSFINDPLSSFTELTFDCWFKLDPTETNAFLISSDTLRLYLEDSNTWYINPSFTTGKSFTWTFNSNWNNIIVTANSSAITGYINGIAANITTGGALGSQSNMVIGGRDFDSYIKGNMATVKIYNKVLTQAEATQNYNALKGRFGL